MGEEKSSSKWTKLVVVDDNSDGYETKLLKRCLGDADGVMSNNNEIGFTGGVKDEDEALFNWDYGIEAEGATGFNMDNVLHPHLIKLVPTSAGQPRLCNTTGFVLTGVDNINDAGYCRASDPAGFYGVLYFRKGVHYYEQSASRLLYYCAIQC